MKKDIDEQLITHSSSQRTGMEIAVIGLSGRFPGAVDINEYWENLQNAVEGICFFSDEELKDAGVPEDILNQENYIKAYGVLSEIENFDASFFGYSPREAELLDPQQRLFHELVWHALEDAGYNPQSYQKLIGLYAGASDNFVWGAHSYSSGEVHEIDLYSINHLVNKDFLCVRISYKLNLKGPAVVVQSTCSTSLLAIHMACQGILNGECDIALAGGVNIKLLNKTGYFYREGMILSPDGHCRAFSSNAKGTISGDGAGVVVLKSLEEAENDGDNIYAIIKGSGINNDGDRKIGFTAPSIEGQADAIITALEMSEIEPESVSYIESHGTGTPLGDPVEIEALTLGYQSEMKQYCAIGSVKSNLGHLDCAAGVAGFIKAVLSLKHRKIPPSLHYTIPNPKIDFSNTPFYVNHCLREWKSQEFPLRAGVSSFGIGGTNVHMILEEWESPHKCEEDLIKQNNQLLLLSAPTKKALENSIDNLGNFLQYNPSLSLQDTAYTLQSGRQFFNHRASTVISSPIDHIEKYSYLKTWNINAVISEGKEQDIPVVFMFSGQGSQYINMGYDLYTSEPGFRKELDDCFSMLNSHFPVDLKEILYPSGISQNQLLQLIDRLDFDLDNIKGNYISESDNSYKLLTYMINQTQIAQPLLFIFEYALAKFLIKCGFKPKAMMGHSIGEYTAACISGALSFSNALELVVLRGQLIQREPKGGMLSVPLREDQLIPILKDRNLSIAAVNTPSQCVVSGPHEEIDLLISNLEAEGIKSRVLQTSHAFHSQMMENAQKAFKKCIIEKKIQFNPAQIPFISNVTGRWITNEQISNPEYWSSHLRETVRFSEGLEKIIGNKRILILEVGPGQTLTTLTRQQFNKRNSSLLNDPIVINMTRHPKNEISDHIHFLEKIGQIWSFGKNIDFSVLGNKEKRRKISLPQYPFEKKVFAFPDSLKSNVSFASKGKNPFSPSTLTGDEEKVIFPTCVEYPKAKAKALSNKKISGQRLLIFTKDTTFASGLLELIKKTSAEITSVNNGDSFTKINEDQYMINPLDFECYSCLFKELKENGKLPDRIFHLWRIRKNITNEFNRREFKNLQIQGLLSLHHLFDSIIDLNLTKEIEIKVVSSYMPGEKENRKEVQDLGSSALRSFIHRISQEYNHIKCSSIEIKHLIEKDGADPGQLQMIFNELLSDDTPPVMILQDKKWWEEQLRPFYKVDPHRQYKEKIHSKRLFTNNQESLALGEKGSTSIPMEMDKAADLTQPLKLHGGLIENLIEIWRKHFGLSVIHPNDDFFELGGDSLQAMIVINKIHEQLGLKLSLDVFFSYSTIHKLSEHLQSFQQEKYNSIPAVEKREYYDLSSSQKRLYILQQLDAENIVYNIPFYFSLKIEMTKDQLERIFSQLIDRHESLRTTFHMIQDKPVQRIHENVRLIVEEVELDEAKDVNKYKYKDKGKPSTESIFHINDLINGFTRPFDISKSPLFRVGLVKSEAFPCFLLIDIHHIICDGVSIDILSKDLLVLQQGNSLFELPIQYKDYTYWQKNAMYQKFIQKGQNYWFDIFPDEIPVLELPIDYSRSLIQNFEGSSIGFDLMDSEIELLRSITKESNGTLFITLLTLFTILLSKLSGQSDIVVGTPIANRRHADLQGIIGVFINSLALRNFPWGEKSFKEFLSGVKSNVLSAFENQEYPFEKLVEQLQVNRDTGRNPLFDVMFNLLTPHESGTEITGEISLKNIDNYQHLPGVSKFDLTLIATEIEDQILFKFEYCRKLFHPNTIDCFILYFKTLLRSLLTGSNQKLSELEIITKDQKQKILNDFNQTEATYDIDKSYIQIFAEQLKRTPHHIALVGSSALQRYAELREEVNVFLTYNQLNKESEQIAIQLFDMGVKSTKEEIIGLFTERTIEMVIGLLGILKSGCAYLPIGPEYPSERIHFILKQTKTSILLVTNTKRPIDSSDVSPRMIDLSQEVDFAADINNKAKIDNLKRSANDLLYIIYTSGTTGIPKGVMIENRSMVNLITGITRVIPFDWNDRILSLTTLSFDIFGWEVLLPLVRGSSVVIGNEREQSDPSLSLFELVRHQITIFQLTPSRLQLFLFYPGIKKEFKSINHLIVGGEAFPPSLLEKAKKFIDGRIYNGYGPTETTIYSAIKDITDENDITIGTPLANTHIYIVDKSCHLQPVGIAGELCISGHGLGRGYFKDENLTAEKFPSNPFCEGIGFIEVHRFYNRLYHTGDLGRWLSNGNIEFLGRIDHQVKLRGYRIELGEIESHLLKIEGIKETVVSLIGKNEDKQLCAYIVKDESLYNTIEKNKKDSSNYLESKLKENLSKILPPYMIPSFFVQLDQLPLTANGKINRKALPLPEFEKSIDYIAPMNKIEQILAKIWASILNISSDKISIFDNFFKLGGHSLKATILISKIHKELKVKLPLVEVFNNQTINGLSNFINEAKESLYLDIQPIEKRDYYEMSSAQKRIYFLQQVELDSTAYNMPLVLHLEEAISETYLENALIKLIYRHESFRTCFPIVNDLPFQKVIDSNEIQFAMEDMNTDFSSDKKFQNINSMISEIQKKFIRPFVFSKAPLIRSGLFRLHDKHYIWMLDAHHIISDGTSHTIISEDFFNFYNNKKLKPLRLQYKDFADWQNVFLKSEEINKQEQYWLNLLSRELPRIELNLDFPRPEVFKFIGKTLKFKLDQKDTQAFKEMGNQNGATLYMNMLTALNVLLFKYTNQNDIIIGTGIAGRPHADLQNIIGMFVNTLIIRNYPHGEMSYETFLSKIINVCVNAFENQDIQFEDLVEKLNLKKDPSRNPIFDISMVVQNFRKIDEEILINSDNQRNNISNIKPLSDKNISLSSFENQTSKFDLTFFVLEQGDDIFIEIEYYTGIFKEETIRRIAEHFQQVIKKVSHNPFLRLSDIELIPDEEKEQLLSFFNETIRDYPQDQTLVTLWLEQSKKNSHQIALDYNHEALTYKELREKASSQVAYLFFQKAVKPGADETIGIIMDHPLELSIAVFGILQAGAAYVPLDPQLPIERIKYIINDADINIIISEKKYINLLNHLQWECHCFHSYLCADSYDINEEEDTQTNGLMNRELWHHVGETATDEITGGGWISSYTGESFTQQEMDEYGDNILKKLEPILHPKMRVLEIGCASGISMFRIAPKVDLYYGTDLSEVIIEKNREIVSRENIPNIKLATRAAHELTTLDEGNFDLIIINSVIQCFHGHQYLKKVIKQSIELLGDQGYLFIGDVMDLEMREDLIQDMNRFKYATENQGKGYATKTDFSSELFIPRKFWKDLGVELQVFEEIRFSNKIHTIANELTKFRYDTLISISKGLNKRENANIALRYKYQDDLRNVKAAANQKQVLGINVLKDLYPHHLAYIIYTSGTTGKPKGVEVEHQGVVNTLLYRKDAYQMDDSFVCLQLFSFAFDGYVTSFFTPLISGSRIILLNKATLGDIEKIKEAIVYKGVNHFICVPALFSAFIEILNPGEARVLKVVTLAGDKVTNRTLETTIAKNPNLEIVNEYGVTESSVMSTIYHHQEKDPVIKIGHPIANTQLYIYNQFLQLQPIGIGGELCISGDGLARGYLNRPELTAERFCLWQARGLFSRKLPPFIGSPCHGGPRKNFLYKQKFLRGPGAVFLKRAPGAQRNKIYRTGDLARWLVEGNIEFLGRIDFQVKVRGFRIELGEIENRLVSHHQINKAVVIDQVNFNEEKYLCAYIVASGAIDVLEIKNYLAIHLPDYMIPAFLIQLEKIPLTISGKVDRKALPKPDYKRTEKFKAPGNELERTLAEIWGKILNINKDQISILDNFFELGGHSLKATILTTQIHKILKVKIPLIEIFKLQNIYGLANYISSLRVGRYASIQAVEKRDYYQLSPAQKRLYILQQLDLDSTAYNMPFYFPLADNISRERLERVFQQLIERHESLRTCFLLVNESPVQKVIENNEVDFKIEYMNGMENLDVAIDGSTPGGEVKTPGEISKIMANFRRPFHLATAPLLRALIVQLESEEQTLFLDMHHIITDGTSQGILEREFLSLLQEGNLIPLRIHYKDYSEWQNASLQKEALGFQESYWLKLFSDEVPVLNLPFDYPRPLMQRFEGKTVDFFLSEKETGLLTEFAAQNDSTLYMVLLSIYTIFLSKLSGQEDIIVGTPVAARRHADLESIVGMFVNTLAMRNSPIPSIDFIQYLKIVKKVTLNAFENQEYQFEELVEKVSIQRDTSRNPVFDVMLNLLNQHEVSVDKTGFNKIYKKDEPDPIQFIHKKSTSKFDLNLTAVQEGRRLSFSLEYSSLLFKPETIDRYIGYFLQILYLISENTRIKISEIDILSKKEKEEILQYCSGVYEKNISNRTIHDLFQEQANQNNNKIALVLKDLMVTYQEIEERSEHLAHVLIHEGVSIDGIVGLMLNRSTLLIVAILGIFKVGAAYLPVDSKLPKDRIKYILSDSVADILITSSDLAQDKNIQDDPKFVNHLNSIFINDIDFSSSPSSFHTLPPVSSSTLAYIIYTSGTTGHPKGVMITHENVVNLFEYQFKYTNINNTKILQFATISFDASFHEIFSALLYGGTLYLIKEEMRSNIEELFHYININEIPTVFFPMSFLRMLFGEESYISLIPDCLNHIQTAGEQVVINENFREYLHQTGIFLHNHYGPSETHVVTTLTLDPNQRIPERPSIGKPILNTSIYIFNNGMNLLPIGIPGELYIGGIQVGKGYLNNPELTDERFCLKKPGALFKKTAPGPRKNFLYKKQMKSFDQTFSKVWPPAGSSKPNCLNKYYKTGDLARWLSDGNIEFLGRIDHQVKIRGFRIEMGEIESNLLNYPGIKGCVVIANKDGKGDKYLCAYIVSEKEIERREIREFLLNRLPDFMVPSYFVYVEEIPVTISGKVNQKVLPKPDFNSEQDYTPPRNDLEKQLSEIWMDILEIDALKNPCIVGIDSNFFELGGQSLKATILVSRIQKYFSVNISLADIFKFPTIRDLSNCIIHSEKEHFNPIKSVEKKEYYELSINQKRLWYIQQKNPDDTSYHIIQIISFNQSEEWKNLQKALLLILERHEGLRTCFQVINGNPVQRILKSDEINFCLQVVDLLHEKKDEKERIYRQIIKNVYKTPFSLDTPPLFRAVLIKKQPDEYMMIYNLHHIITDGWSMELLKKELNQIQSQLNQNSKINLRPLNYQYKEFTTWQNERIIDQVFKVKVHQYWQKKFESHWPILQLSHLYKNSNENNDDRGDEAEVYNKVSSETNISQGGRYTCQLNEQIVKMIDELAIDNHTSPFSILFTFFNLLLVSLSGQDEVSSIVVHAGRTHTSLQPIVGYFVNPIYIKLSIDFDEEFEDLLARVTQEVLEAFQYQDYPSELILDDLQKERPNIPIAFNMMNMRDVSNQIKPDKAKTSHQMINHNVKFDIQLSLIEYENGIELSWDYRRNLFSQQTIESIAQEYLDLFNELISKLEESE